MSLRAGRSNRRTLRAIEAILSHREDFELLGCDPARRSWSTIPIKLLFDLQSIPDEGVKTIGVFAELIGADAQPLFEWEELVQRNIQAVLAEKWTDPGFLRSACERAYYAWPPAQALLKKLRAYLTLRHAEARRAGVAYDDERDTFSADVLTGADVRCSMDQAIVRFASLNLGPGDAGDADVKGGANGDGARSTCTLDEAAESISRHKGQISRWCKDHPELVATRDSRGVCRIYVDVLHRIAGQSPHRESARKAEARMEQTARRRSKS